MDVCAGSPASGFEHRASRERWGIDTSHIRQHGELTGQGPAPLGKRLVPATAWVSSTQLTANKGSHPVRRSARLRIPMAPATVWGSTPRLPAISAQRSDVQRVRERVESLAPFIAVAVR